MQLNLSGFTPLALDGEQANTAPATMLRETQSGEWKIAAVGKRKETFIRSRPFDTVDAIATNLETAFAAVRMAMLFAKSGTNVRALLF